MSLQPTSAIKDEFNPDTAAYPLMAFRKIDGVRASHLKGFFHGRSMDPFKNHALNTLFHHPMYAGFDGELTIDGLLTDETLDGETLCSLTTGLTNRSKIKKGETELPTNAVWNLFDYLDERTVTLPYLERYQNLDLLVGTLAPPNVTVLQYVMIYNAVQARLWIIDCMEQGYEGAIFRDPRALHKSGRAAASKNDFWRYKPVSDKDAIVTGVYEALTNNNEKTTNSRGHSERSSHKENKTRKGTVGGFFALDVTTGRPIKVPAGCMKQAERLTTWELWLTDPDAVRGRPIKYASLDVGVKDEPRQARFIAWRSKEDMTPEDLTLIKQMEIAA